MKENQTKIDDFIQITNSRLDDFDKDFCSLFNLIMDNTKFLLSQERKLAHNDAQRSNIVKDLTGNYFLIDYEFAADNDPIYDIATFGNDNVLEGKKLLDEYVKINPTDDALKRYCLWRIDVSLQWYLVAIIKHFRGEGKVHGYNFLDVANHFLENAKKDGYKYIIDGTNASDDAGDRPGMRALKEMQVLSPLQMCGLTKDDVRSFSKEAGMFTWNKPSYACLATRIPTGEEITNEKLAKVEKCEKDWQLKIFGSGDRAAYQRLVEKMGLKNVTLNGTVKDVNDAFREGSIMVFSSRYEGFGMVLIEAMACGLPTVSFACPCGPRDIIQEGEDGFLVEDFDTDKLADRLLELMHNDTLRKDMGKRARQNMQRFMQEDVMQKWQTLLCRFM